MHRASQILVGILLTVGVGCSISDASADVTSSTEHDSPAGQPDRPTLVTWTEPDWDTPIKRERLKHYESFRAELAKIFVDDPFPAETTEIPGPGFASLHATGDTARLTLTLDLSAAPDSPIVANVIANHSTKYLHSWMDRWALVQDRARRPSFEHYEFDAAALQPGTVETVRVDRSAWSRGLTTGEFRDATETLDPQRWYADGAVLLSADAAFLTPDQLWASMEEPLPDQVDVGSGRTVYTAEVAPRVLSRLFGLLGRPSSRDATASLSTTFDQSGRMERLDVEYTNDPMVSGASFVVNERDFVIDVPDITDVVRSPFDPIRDLPDDSYSWTAVGTSVGVDESDEPWSAVGRASQGSRSRSYMKMTALDISRLRGWQSVSVPGRTPVERWGNPATFRSAGLFAEIAPMGADLSEVSASQTYLYDPFGVPGNLFPHGLGEMAQWRELRVLPQIVDLPDWDNHRVTTARIDNDYWNYRHRLNHGFFGWLISEHRAEVFAVTVGADASGRLERFEIRTTEADGGGLLLDIRIDDVTKEPIIPARGGFSSGFAMDPTYLPPGHDREAFAKFATTSRSHFPVIDRSRTPDYLTVMASERYSDSPPVDSEATASPTWSGSPFQPDVTTHVQDDDGSFLEVACFAWNDNEWRYEENGLERLWRAYPDGSELDDLLLIFNPSLWQRLEVYATDGERMPGDPCASS